MELVIKTYDDWLKQENKISNDKTININGNSYKVFPRKKLSGNFDEYFDKIVEEGEQRHIESGFAQRDLANPKYICVMRAYYEIAFNRFAREHGWAKDEIESVLTYIVNNFRDLKSMDFATYLGLYFEEK